MENHKYEVKINGVEYVLISNESEEYVQRVALLVNKKMNQIMEVNPQLSTAMSAVLTSLNLADEYLKNEACSITCVWRSTSTWKRPEPAAVSWKKRSLRLKS